MKFATPKVYHRKPKKFIPLNTTVALDAEHMEQFNQVKAKFQTENPTLSVTDAALLRHLVSLGLRAVLGGDKKEFKNDGYHKARRTDDL
jgi:hypothetical protein